MPRTKAQEQIRANYAKKLLLWLDEFDDDIFDHPPEEVFMCLVVASGDAMNMSATHCQDCTVDVLTHVINDHENGDLTEREVGETSDTQQ